MSTLDDLNVRLKSALNSRLKLPPAAEFALFLARSSDLAPTETKVAMVVFAWTLGAGEKWQPMSTVGYTQFADGAGREWSFGTGRTIQRALDGLLRKGVLHRIWRGQGQRIAYHFALIEELLTRPHRYHDGEDVDRDEVDELIGELQAAEAAGETARRFSRAELKRYETSALAVSSSAL